jgi:nucleoside-triphosphatase THEP1
VSGNKTGISVYILGLKDKKHLAKTYGTKLGKARVTGYCIRFKALKDINIGTLEEAIRHGLATKKE